MTTVGYTLFETPVGLCGLAWSDEGIRGLQLPEGNERETRRRLAAPFSATVPFAATGEAAKAIAQIEALLRGDPTDLESLVLDLHGVPQFNASVYAVARRIPPGRTTTYGDIARRLGSVGLSRAVGRALGQNPFAIIVPCHRVVSAAGTLGGFSAHGGAETKVRLLALEGALLRAPRLPLDAAPGR